MILRASCLGEALIVAPDGYHEHPRAVLPGKLVMKGASSTALLV